MIRLFVYALAAIVLALLAIVFLDLPADPGYLLIAFGDYTFETSLLALVLAAVVIYLIYRLLRMLLEWINPWQLVRASRRVGSLFSAGRRGKTEEGMLALFRGNWQSAYNLLMQGSREREANVVNFLAAAYAANKLNQPELWTNSLETAERRYPHARSTVGIVRAHLLQHGGQSDQALKAINNLRKSVLNDASLLGLLKQVYIDLEDWDELEKLLPTLERNKMLDEAELLRLRRHIFAQRLHAAGIGRDASLDREESLATLRQMWKKAPADFHQSPALVSHYARLALHQGGEKEAAAAIEQALTAQWNSDLIELYGSLPLGDEMRRLNLAEEWLEKHKEDAGLQLTLGRLCLRNELWGKAKEYLQASIAANPTAAAHGELSRLLENLAEPAAAKTHLAQYRTLAAEPLPDLPQPKPTPPQREVS